MTPNRLTAVFVTALGIWASWAAGTASARQTDWFVTAAVAERVTNKAFKATAPSVPMGTECFGVGGSLKPKYPGGPRFYQRFYCTVSMFLPSSTRKLKVTFRVRSKHWASLQVGWGLYGREIGRYRMFES